MAAEGLEMGGPGSACSGWEAGHSLAARVNGTNMSEFHGKPIFLPVAILYINRANVILYYSMVELRVCVCEPLLGHVRAQCPRNVCMRGSNATPANI